MEKVQLSLSLFYPKQNIPDSADVREPFAEDYSTASSNSNYDLHSVVTMPTDFSSYSTTFLYNGSVSEAKVFTASRYSKNFGSGFDTLVPAMMTYLYPNSISYLTHLLNQIVHQTSFLAV